MIRQLRGTIVHVSETAVMLLTNGIGYLVFTPQPHRLKTDQEVILHTHLAVRETALDLYGFKTMDELELFELLLTVPKVGPKSALAIMSNVDSQTITQAVMMEDPSHLTKVGGIGKKTAEKIVIELKDKLPEAMTLAADADGTDSTERPFAADAIDALVTLGYPQADARKVINNLSPNISTVNDAVRAALTELNQS